MRIETHNWGSELAEFNASKIIDKNKSGNFSTAISTKIPAKDHYRIRTRTLLNDLFKYAIIKRYIAFVKSFILTYAHRSLAIL